MKIKSQDLKPGMLVRHNGSPWTRLAEVHVFDERKSAFTPIGAAQAYLPGCVMVTWVVVGGRNSYTFQINEELERVFE